MKTYAILALILSSIALCWSALVSINFAHFTMHEAAPYLLGYAALMTAYALISFLYIKKRERRRAARRKRTMTTLAS